MKEIAQTDKASLDTLLDEVVSLLNDHEPSEAMQSFRRHFGLVNRWVCEDCKHQSNSYKVSYGCPVCGSRMHVMVVRDKEVR